MPSYTFNHVFKFKKKSFSVCDACTNSTNDLISTSNETVLTANCTVYMLSLYVQITYTSISCNQTMMVPAVV